MKRSSAVVAAATILVLTGASSSYAAGAVTTSLMGGGLLLTGDAEDNSFDLADPESDGTWLIRGKGGTLIDGMEEVTIAAVTGGISIVMLDGKDSIKMQGGDLGNALFVQMGSGNDKFSVSGAVMSFHLHFEGQDGDDKLSIKDLLVSDPDDVDDGSSIEMDEAMPGKDSVKIKNFADQHLFTDLGAGDDKFSMSKSTMVPAEFTGLQVFGEAGTDSVKLNTVGATANFYLDLGEGDGDSLKVINCQAPSYTLDGGAGIDDKLKQSKNTPEPNLIINFEVM